MAFLQKIRVKFGVLISVLIGIALLSFIIDPGTLEGALNSMSSKYDVGKVAGKKVTYTDFQETVDKYTTINELMTGTSAKTDEMQTQIRNAAWQVYVDKYMFIKNCKAAGINVGEAEIVDLMSGDNLSPIMAQNPVFMDEAGYFSNERLNSFISNMHADESGNLSLYWNYLQNTVSTQQYYSKYYSLFSASNYENALQLADDMAFNNTTADFKYCVEMYPVAQDSTVTVSDSEIKAYYNAHKNFFRQNASREIEYVVFEVVPSQADIDAASADFEAAYSEFTTTDNVRNFLLRNSDRSYSEYWYKEGELNTISAELNTSIFTDKKDVTPIITRGNSFYAGRTMATEMLPDSVFVKHILLQGDDAHHLADSLVNVVGRRGVSFANVAAQYSADQNSAADGELGSLGWMTQTYMIPGLESVITANVGQPYVVDTQYGTHVVLVTERTKPVLKKQVAVLEKTAIASRETFNTYYAQANNFAAITAGKLEGYRRAVDSTKVYSHAITVTEATSNYGAVENAKEVTRWIFDNKVGKASNIITVNNNYFFIATVKKINKEGYTPVEDVASVIRQRLYAQKVQDKVLEDTKAKLAGVTSVEKAAEVLGTEVETREAQSLAAMNVDPALLGAASSAQEGEFVGPFPGGMGVYVMELTGKNTGSFYTEDDARNFNLQKSQYTSQLIIGVMSEYDEVKDNRARFF